MKYLWDIMEYIYRYLDILMRKNVVQPDLPWGKHTKRMWKTHEETRLDNDLRLW